MQPSRRRFLGGTAAVIASTSLARALPLAEAGFLSTGFLDDDQPGDGYPGEHQAAVDQSAGNQASAVRESAMARDPRRPQFHLLPAANWMNDPNGPLYWKGEYHMFFQYNPGAAVWGDMHWAHAASADMVHWRHRPIALSPTPGGADADGCFSGSAVAYQGVPTFIYTAVEKVAARDATLRDGNSNLRETQCLATSDEPSLNRWSKLAHPVIATPPPGLEVTGFRDPCLWQQGEWWYLNIGSGVRKRGGMVLLYRSKDLRRWEYLHPLVEGSFTGATAVNPVDSGEMWECPDFFQLGKKHVLIYSTEGKVLWQSGTLDLKSLRFRTEQSGVLDYGSFYAPKTQLDKDGRRILWGWIQETRPVEEYRAAGWAGMMSLPRVLDLDGDGQLLIRFGPALRELRGAEQKAVSGKSRTLTLAGCSGEVICTAQRGAKSFRLTVRRRGADGPPILSVAYDPADRKSIAVDGKSLALAAAEQAPLSVHLFADGSVIEMLVNERLAVTRRFYYAGETAPELEVVFSGGGEPEALEEFTAWAIQPISPDRLTT